MVFSAQDGITQEKATKKNEAPKFNIQEKAV
ncbi:MAG: hypothetical protein K0Q55_843, partial [Verrucomicrobia bacterium]|nr:hypothetical protein [Verrucomicrobiota bacterium]